MPPGGDEAVATPDGAVDVSVLVVNYHAYPELAACLESIRGQRLARIETIVVDHDSSPDECAALQDRFPFARFFPTPRNPGFAAGVNLAARQARGRYLYLLNPDAVADKAACQILLDWLELHGEAGVVGSLVRNPDGSIQASARRFPDLTTVFGGRTSFLTQWRPGNPLTRRNLLTGADVRAPKLVDWVSGASMMIRRTAFDAVGGMDERFFLYWEDADLCYRITKAGWRVGYHPTAVVTHLCGRSSRSSPASIAAFHDSAYRYFKKHSGPMGRVLSPLVYLGLNIRLLFLLIARRQPVDGQGV